MGDNSQRERPAAGRPKQYRVGRDVGSGDGTSHGCLRPGSPSAPCAPSLVCAATVCEPTAASTTRAKMTFSDCMKLPDAATEMKSDQPEGYARRIKSAAFFVQVARRKA